MDIASLIEEQLKGKPFVAPKVEPKKTRQSKNPIDWNDVDIRVFKAVLHFTFSGCNFSKLVETCPTFIRKNDAANRAMINKSLDSLKARGLVDISGYGMLKHIKACNGASMASYYARGESPIARPDVYRRTTVKEPENTTNTEDFSDADYEDLNNDLSEG